MTVPTRRIHRDADVYGDGHGQLWQRLTCDQIITFTDTEAPAMSDDAAELYPASIPVLTWAIRTTPASCRWVPRTTVQEPMEVANAYGLGFLPGNVVRHWVAYDDCGNMSAEAIQYIPTYDIVAPEVSIAARVSYRRTG